jgi:hypothetical protein
MPQPLTKSEVTSLFFSGVLPCLTVFLYSEYMRSVEGAKGELPGIAQTCATLYLFSFAVQAILTFYPCSGSREGESTICSIEVRSVIRFMSLLNATGMGVMFYNTAKCFYSKPEVSRYATESCRQCSDDGTHHNLYPIAMLAYAGVCLVYLSMRGRQQCMQSGNPPIGDTSSRDGSDPSGDFVLGGYSDSEEETWRDRVSRWRMGMGAGVD